ncbi:MAG: hypothetical protein NTU57_02650 [Candidatus Aenigmarchaeota archaeon]|nr:hypothetical protein [Candidatus Aenigmarchaeota archaeon]
MNGIMDTFYPVALVLSASVCSLIINKIATRILKFIEKHTGIDKVLDQVDGKLGLKEGRKKSKK